MSASNLLLGAICAILVWAVRKWRADVALAERRLQVKRKKCAAAYNQRLLDNYSQWFTDMTKAGYRPTYVEIRELTPDEIGVEEWQTPEEYLKLDPDWHGHPDFEELLHRSYTDEQRAQMKQPGWKPQPEP